jgi:hypothetical protein
MITNGTYRAKASGACVLGTSANKGTPYLELYFKVVEGDHKNTLVRWTGYFTENTNERTIQSMILMGWKGDDVSEFVDGALHGLDANEVDIVIEIEEYENAEGETRHSPRVQWVNRPGGYLNTDNAMKTEAALSFRDKMRGLVLAVREKVKAPAKDGTDFPHGANAPNAEGAPPPKAF